MNPMNIAWRHLDKTEAQVRTLVYDFARSQTPKGKLSANTKETLGGAVAKWFGSQERRNAIVTRNLRAAVRRVNDAIAAKLALPFRDRMAARTIAEVRQAFTDAGYRRPSLAWCDRAGENVRIVVSATETPGVASESGRVWDSGGRVRSGTSVDHTLFVKPTWLTRVWNRGNAVISGMLTLSAEPVELTPQQRRRYPDCTVYAAVWVEQGRGLIVKQVRGFLADAGMYAAHGQTVASALVALDKQRNPHRLQDKRRAQAEKLHAARTVFGDTSHVLLNLFAIAAAIDAGALDCVVTLADSSPRTSGNCESGTRDWINKNAPGRTSATVREVLQLALKNNDRFDLALRACVYAIRRQVKTLVKKERLAA